MNTPEPQAPVLYHQGQPISSEAAAEQRADLVKNSEFLKAALSGKDEAKNRLLSDLYEISRGRQPGGSTPAPQDAASVQAQQDERELANQRKVMDVWEQHMRLDDVQRFQLERGEAKESEIRTARLEIARLKKDSEFVKALQAGDAEAMDAWCKFHKIGYGMKPIAG